MEFSQVMVIDSCVHIPMDCEDTKKRNMSREVQQRSNYGQEVIAC
jgi:hypothetical protein